VIVLKHFPDGLEVVFLGYAGFLASQIFPYWVPIPKLENGQTISVT
jgi:hypothetical protein